MLHLVGHIGGPISEEQEVQQRSHTNLGYPETAETWRWYGHQRLLHQLVDMNSRAWF